MSKIHVLFIACLFVIPGFLAVDAQQDTVQQNTPTNHTTSQNIFEHVISDYQQGVKFKDVIPIGIGILGFSYFIIKTSVLLSKREPTQCPY